QDRLTTRGGGPTNFVGPPPPRRLGGGEWRRAVSTAGCNRRRPSRLRSSAGCFSTAWQAACLRRGAVRQADRVAGLLPRQVRRLVEARERNTLEGFVRQGCADFEGWLGSEEHAQWLEEVSDRSLLERLRLGVWLALDWRGRSLRAGRGPRPRRVPR